MTPTWAERKVIESVGIDPDEAADYVIEQARVALELCYYIDRAADELAHRLRLNRSF